MWFDTFSRRANAWSSLWLIFDLDSITDHPEFNLFESGLPPILEVFQPLSVFDGVSDIDYKLDQVVAIQNSGVAPVSFNFLCFLACSAKVDDDFQVSLSQPLRRQFPAIIKLEGQEHLVSPPIAAHR